jgi:hypothetical protein
MGTYCQVITKWLVPAKRTGCKSSICCELVRRARIGQELACEKLHLLARDIFPEKRKHPVCPRFPPVPLCLTRPQSPRSRGRFMRGHFGHE